MSTRSLARTVAEWEAIYGQLLEMRDGGAAERVADGLRKTRQAPPDHVLTLSDLVPARYDAILRAEAEIQKRKESDE